MFHIEDKYDDLNHIVDDKYQGTPIGTDANDALWEIAVETEKLGDEIRTMTDALKFLHREMSVAGNCDVQAMFGHIDGIEELDERALQVVEALLQDLCFDFQHKLKELTKYDRVDED